MRRLRRAQQLAAKTDPLVNWGERAGKLLWKFLLWVVGPSTLSGLGLGVLAYLTTYSFLYTAIFALAAFALAQLGLSFWAIRKSAVRKEPFAEPELETTTPQYPTPRQTVDLQALLFGIPTTKDVRERLTQLVEENERSASPDPLTKVLAGVLAENDRLRAERDETRIENERLSAKIQQLDEEVKRRCLALVDELAEFVNERAQEHPEKKTWRPNLREVIPYNKETVEQYNRRFGREVAVLLDILERRGCWSDPKERKKFENPKMALSIRNLQTLVRRLAVLCERL